MSRSLKMQQLLISNGYFPKELPPAYTTRDFGGNIGPIIDDWETTSVFKKEKKTKKIRFEEGFTYCGLPHADPETISMPKRGYERRDLHITHPIPQALLATEIANNWNKLRHWLERKKFSGKSTTFVDVKNGIIKPINFSLYEAKKAFIEASSNWILKTDISGFYPNIYTHSITWAAYGKNEVKLNLRRFDGSLADRFDILVRSCNQNQTIGLPVGPETSRILAEIISSRIESDILQKIRKNIKNFDAKRVIRQQDDWLIGCSSVAEAESILSCIRSCYREYGLRINGAKTSIENLRRSTGSNWKEELTGRLSETNHLPKGGKLKDFFSVVTRQQIENPTAPVLNYVLAIIERHSFTNNEIAIVETFLLKASLISPGCLDRICRILLNLNFISGVSKKRISARFLELIESHTDTSSLYEIIWLLYALRGLRQSIKSRRLSEFSADFPSSTLRLLLLDIDSLGLMTSKLAKEEWSKAISIERSLSSWSWLYSYEAVRKGWLKGPENLLNAPFFRALNIRNINFYDSRRNVPSSWSVNEAIKKNRIANQIEIARTMSLLRGEVAEISTIDESLFEFSDG